MEFEDMPRITEAHRRTARELYPGLLQAFTLKRPGAEIIASLAHTIACVEKEGAEQNRLGAKLRRLIKRLLAFARARHEPSPHPPRSE